MSAMHWEARRRQSALDRRTAQRQQQLVPKSAESCSDGADTNTTQAQTACELLVCHNFPAEGRCPHCKAALEAPVHHGAKIANRYSSLQYSQQW